MIENLLFAQNEFHWWCMMSFLYVSGLKHVIMDTSYGYANFWSSFGYINFTLMSMLELLSATCSSCLGCAKNG